MRLTARSAAVFALVFLCYAPAAADYSSYFPYLRHNKATASPSPSPAPSATPAALPPPTATAKFQAVDARHVGPDGPGRGGQSGLQLDAVGAVTYALEHNPQVLDRVSTLATDIQTFSQRRAAEYPSIVATLQNQLQKSANLSGTLAQYGVVPENNFSQNTAEIAAQYNIYNGNATIAAKLLAREAERDAQDLETQRETTVTQVINAFYGLAARRGDVAVAQNDLAYQQALLAAATASERVGRVAGVDVLKAQVAVTRSQSTLVQAEADRASASESLAVLIGAAPRTLFLVPDPVPEPALPENSPDRLTLLAQSTRPEIKAALANFRASKLNDASVDADLRPVFQVTGAFGSQVSPTSFVQEQQQVDAENAQLIANYQLEKAIFPTANVPPPTLLGAINRRVPGFWQLNLQSTFQIPVIDYGQRALAHKAARAQVEASLANLTNAYDSVEADVRAAQRNAQAAKEKLALAKASAALARESARIANLQYKNGLISFTDVSDTEQTAVSAENDLVTARVAYVEAFVRLRVALGPPDPIAATDLRGL